MGANPDASNITVPALDYSNLTSFKLPGGALFTPAGNNVQPAAGQFVDTTSSPNTKSGPLTVSRLNAATVASPNTNGVLKYYNVVDFGAVGDGFTNDYAAIASAIAAAVAVGKPYILFFPAAQGNYFIGANTLTLTGTPACILHGKQHSIISGTASPVLSLTHLDSINSIAVQCGTNSGVVIADSVNVGGSTPNAYGLSPIYRDLWITSTSTTTSAALLTCLGGAYWTFTNLKCAILYLPNRAATGVSIQSGTSHTFINPQITNVNIAFSITNNPAYGYGFNQGIFITSPNVLEANIGIQSYNCDLLSVTGGSLDQCYQSVLQSFGDTTVIFNGVYCGFFPSSSQNALFIVPQTSGHVGPAGNAIAYVFNNCFFVNYSGANSNFLNVNGAAGLTVNNLSFTGNTIAGVFYTLVVSNYMANLRFDRSNYLLVTPTNYWINSNDQGGNFFFNECFPTLTNTGLAASPGTNLQHAVQGTIAGTGSTTSVYLSGSAAFSTNVSYIPFVFDCSAGAFVTSGFYVTTTLFTFPSTNGHVYLYWFIGY